MKAGSKGQRHDPLLTFEQLLIGVDTVVSKGFCVCVRACRCSSEAYKVSDSWKVHINATFLHIVSISTELRFFHPLLAVVFMIATAVRSLNRSLWCSETKNAVYLAEVSFSLVLKMDYVVVLIAKGILGRLAPIKPDSHISDSFWKQFCLCQHLNNFKHSSSKFKCTNIIS